MNVGGSTDTNVVAMYDNTNVTLNGVALPENPLSAGEVVNLTTAQFDVIDADKPIFTAGRVGSGGASTKDNVTWTPALFAGTEFASVTIRSSPHVVSVYAIEDTTVEVKEGSTVLASATMLAGTGQNLSWGPTGSFQVFSTGTILTYQYSSVSGQFTDGKILMPAHDKILGFPSSSMRLTTIEDSTNYEFVHSNSVTGLGSLNRDGNPAITPEGTTSLYQSESLLVTADKDITGTSFADSTGLNAAPFIPTNLLKKVYAVNVLSVWVAFASLESGSIDQYDPGDVIGVSTPVATLALVNSGTDPDAPFRARTVNITAGTRFVSTVGLGGWYEPANDVGGADDDETILVGTDYIE